VNGTAAGFARPDQRAGASKGHNHNHDRGGDEGSSGQDESGEEGEGEEGSSGLSLLAHDLVGLAAQMGMQLETFSVGMVAHQLGGFGVLRWVCCVGSFK